MPGFGETSPVLRPWETHPAVSQREGERCPVLESSVSQTPGAEIPSLPPAGVFTPGVCQSPTGSAEEPGAQPSPAPQPWGLAPILQLQRGSSAYWVKILNVLQERVPPPPCLNPGKLSSTHCSFTPILGSCGFSLPPTPKYLKLPFLLNKRL